MSKAHLPAPARERGRIAPAKLAHFVRKTSQREKMSAWYKTVLEAEVILENENFSFLTYDEEHHRVAILAIPGLEPAPENAAGTDHIAFTYADLSDLLATYQRLKAAGITPYWSINHGPTTSMYYRDPDGNAVELQIDNFSSAQETADWMASGEFDRNPVGIVFDPDELSEQFNAGVPVSELTRRPPLPEGMSRFDMVRV